MPAWLPASPRALLGRSDFERQMEAELAFHIEAHAADLERRGTPPADAVRLARLAFGRVDGVKEHCRQTTGFMVWDRGWQDVRGAWRMMRRQAGLTLTVVATLALCIGANTAVFSIVDAVLLRPLPYADPERLVRVEAQFSLGPRSLTLEAQTGETWQALREGVLAIEIAVFMEGLTDVNYAAPQRAERLLQQRVSAGFFDVLGVAPLIGRGFTQDEDTRGGPAAVVLSHGFWMRAFGGRRDVLGESILLRGAPHQVVGVMPAGFTVGAPPDVWTPLRPSIAHEGRGHNYSIIGRVRPGVTHAQAEAEIDRLGRATLAEFERGGVTVRMRLIELQQSLAVDVRGVLVRLWSAVGLVLLVGCVNVAGLMLARGGRMRREIAMRIALGSGRLGVVRQLLVESLALALCGGAVGTVVGLCAIGAVRPFAIEQLGVWQPFALDLRVLTMTLAATLATSVIFGLAPVLDACRLDVRSALSGAPAPPPVPGRANRSRRVRAWSSWNRHALTGHLIARRVFVVTEIASSVVLLVAAGLLLRTFLHLHRQEAGFNPRGVLTAAISLEDSRYASRDRLDRLFDDSLASVRALPGVAQAAIGLRLPYELAFNATLTHVGDAPPLPGSGRMTNVAYVTTDYFDVLRIPRVRGRTFDARDTAGARPVVVVNQVFAARHLPGRNPIGERITVDDVGAREIVGVVGAVQQAPAWHGGQPNREIPAIYLAAAQTPDTIFALAHVWFSPSVIVQTADTVATGAQRDSIRRALEVVDPLLPIGQVRPADELKAGAFSAYRFEAAGLGTFAALALLLAAVGLYGIVAHGLAERRREFGIRAAIGASRWQAVRAAAMPGLRLATIGILIGCLLGWLFGRTLRHLVVGVTAADAVPAFAIVAGTLFVVAAAASFLPAVAGTRLNIADTLRAE